jgi:hypothetical protein
MAAVAQASIVAEVAAAVPLGPMPPAAGVVVPLVAAVVLRVVVDGGNDRLIASPTNA